MGAHRIAAGGALTVGATLAMAGTAQATDFTVGSLADTTGASDCATPTNTDCTLRQAIIDANNNSGADNILFKAGLTGTVTFGTEPPAITGPTDIYGTASSEQAVSGNGTHKVFDIDQTTPGDDVRIFDLTVQNSCCVGAIRNQDADLTVSDSVVTSNSSVAGGAGISSNQGSLTVVRTTVSGNTVTAGNSGGGIWAFNDLTLRDSTVTGNTAGTEGGGVYVGYSGHNGSTYYHRGPHLIENSTIAGNTAGSDGGGVSFCGSNYDADRLTIESSTITGNDASGILRDGYGGGVASRCGVGYYGARLENTIVANNTALLADPDVNGDAQLDASFSLIEEPTGGINEGVAGSNITGVDPLLAPLADNGGATETQALAESSPPVDQGESDLTLDQRSETRPFDIPTIPNSSATGADGSDIGAFERSGSDVAVPVLTVSTGGGGSGTVSGPGIDCTGTGPDCAGAFNEGTAVPLTATAGSESVFAGWSGCDVPSGSQCTMNMNTDKSATATFNLVPASGGGSPPPAAPGPTGRRAKALKKCKKKPKGPKRKKCIKRAKRLPV
jgi:Divergent InlB B-repeat domain